jgi:hypothetical protein
VSCASATDRVAVGYEDASGTTDTLGEQWNGTTWTVQPSASPSGDTPSGMRTLVESWTGSAWKQASSPNPSGDFDATSATSFKVT